MNFPNPIFNLNMMNQNQFGQQMMQQQMIHQKMMQQQMMQQQIMQKQMEQKLKEEEEKKRISVFFRKNEKVTPTIMIPCRLDEKISDIIDKYISKTLEHKENLMFFFDSKKLNPSITVEEAGLLNNSFILVFDVTQMVGG
jgi:hypothetical protein